MPGTTSFTFTVTKTGATSQTVTVQFATASGTAAGGADCSTAATGSPDFINATGPLTFAPGGAFPKTLVTPVCGDPTFELDETFTVNLSNPTNATIVKGTGTGTIQNDDGPPMLSIDRRDSGRGQQRHEDHVRLHGDQTGATTQTATVAYATADGTAIGNTSCAAAATGSPDYLSTSGTLSFAPGETTKTIPVAVCGGPNVGFDREIFTVNLSNPTNATIVKGTGTGTIQNDDPRPTLAIDDVTQVEGNGGTSSFASPLTKTPVQRHKP